MCKCLNLMRGPGLLTTSSCTSLPPCCSCAAGSKNAHVGGRRRLQAQQLGRIQGGRLSRRILETGVPRVLFSITSGLACTSGASSAALTRSSSGPFKRGRPSACTGNGSALLPSQW
jgi:hypothetical protein